jgi:hypothetical protein
MTSNPGDTSLTQKRAKGADRRDTPWEESFMSRLRALNWLALASLTGGAVWAFGPKTALGVLVGGLLVIFNFRLLERALKKTLGQVDPAKARNSHIIKLYLRMAVLGVCIYLLISRKLVEPLGLLVGLSVVMLSVVLMALIEMRRVSGKGAV